MGVTSNLIKRIYQHKHKLIKGFSSRYNLNKLIYYETYDNPKTAIRREKQLKNLLRRKKGVLINKFNPEWEDFYNKIIQ
jgi:putative endonuclease